MIVWTSLSLEPKLSNGTSVRYRSRMNLTSRCHPEFQNVHGLRDSGRILRESFATRNGANNNCITLKSSNANDLAFHPIISPSILRWFAKRSRQTVIFQSYPKARWLNSVLFFSLPWLSSLTTIRTLTTHHRCPPCGVPSWWVAFLVPEIQLMTSVPRYRPTSHPAARMSIWTR